MITNNNTTKTKTQEKKDSYKEFLNERIQDYTKTQVEFYNEIKKFPSFNAFYQKACEYIYNPKNKFYYNIKTKKTLDFKLYESSMCGFYEDLYNEFSKDFKNQFKNFINLKSLLKILNLTIPMNGLTFNPIIKNNIIFEDDDLLLNEYKEKSITKDKPATTDEEKQVIQTVINHIKALIGNDKILNPRGEITNRFNYEFFLDWIAHQVQNPGVLLRFAPVIQGIQGSGKTFIRKLLQNIISNKYVKPISNDDLKSPFNFYVTNRVVNVVEELKVKGKKDDFVVTKLKEFIANDEFTINRKNIPQYTVKNTANYLMLTNDKNCIPLETNERRYWIIYSPITKEDLMARYNTSYFTHLHDIIVQYKEILRHYFLNYKITQEFKDCNIAPKTQASKELEESTKSNILGYDEAQSLLSNPTPIYNNKIIVSKEFFKCLEEEGIKGFNNTTKSKLLQELGYSKYKKQIRISEFQSRDVYIIYIHNDFYDNSMDKIAVNELLNQSFNEFDEESII